MQRNSFVSTISNVREISTERFSSTAEFMVLVISIILLSSSSAAASSCHDSAVASSCHDDAIATPSCHDDRIATSSHTVDAERKHIKSRIASANKLIKQGRLIEAQHTNLSNRIKAKLLVADSRSSNPWTAYQNLFLEYEKALAAYQEHRREYFAHAQQYHGVQSFSGSAENSVPYGQSSSQSPSMQQSFGTTTSPTGLTPLRVQAQDKCDQLVALETKLIASEGNLSKLVSQLQYGQSRESQSMLIGMWSDAEQVARQVQGMASEFNHQGIQKTGSSSQNVHSLIMEANRDGDYGAHMDAYRQLSRSNNFQQEITKHANLHGQFALQMLSTLNSLRPPGAIPGGGAFSSLPGSPTGTVTEYDPSGGGSTFGPGASYDATQLAQESRALDLEYAQVQELMSRLEVLRQALPPTPPNRK